MKKIYKYQLWYVCVCEMIVLILSPIGYYVMIKDMILPNVLKIILILVGWGCCVYCALIAFLTRYITTEKSIKIAAGKLFNPRELEWENIETITNSGRWYYITSNNYQERSISINSIVVANYKDLLREIIERAPHAKVDYSIKMLVQKNKK